MAERSDNIILGFDSRRVVCTTLTNELEGFCHFVGSPLTLPAIVQSCDAPFSVMYRHGYKWKRMPLLIPLSPSTVSLVDHKRLTVWISGV